MRVQILRRSDRRRVHDKRARQWAARSVWSEVCANDLGLIVAPVTSSTSCTVEPIAIGARCDKIGKPSTCWDSKKKLKSYKRQRTSSCPTQIRSAYFVNCVFSEHSYGQGIDSSVNQSFGPNEESIKSQEFRKSRSIRPLVPRQNIVYNPFSVLRTSNYDSYEQKHEPKNVNVRRAASSSVLDDKKSQSRDKDSSSENDNLEREAERKTKSKLARGVKRIARKRRNRKYRENTVAKLAVRTREEKSRRVFEKSTETYSTVKTRERSRRVRAEISNTRNAEKNVRRVCKNYEKVSKNDYEISDIDESLLVDPFTDLPESLLETIDDTINITNPEFDVTQDFDSDDVLTSNIETLKHDTTASASKTSRSLVKGKTSIGEVNFGRNALRGSVKKTRETSGINNDRIDESDGLEKIDTSKYPKAEKNYVIGAVSVSHSKIRRSADSVIIAAGRTTEKRRRSADEVVVEDQAGLIIGDQRNSGYKETLNSDSLGRVTRSSARNFISSKDDNREPRVIGTIVWGNCKGWWPAFVVDHEDVGMYSQPDKTWVCWIHEYKISHLRDKSQIQPFSTCLRERMIETLASKENSRDPYYKACLETIELINDEILKVGPSTKPHHVWAEKHLTNIENIDRLILYPYPSHVKPRLDELRRVNCKATEKYLTELKTEKAGSSVKVSSTAKNVLKNESTPVAGHLPLMKQKPGVIAWAKIMGQVWWPAAIVDYRDCGMKEPSFGCQWIMWYGDSTMSQVNHRFFLSFETGIPLMKKYVKNCKRECYRRGVIDAARDYCSRLGYKVEDWGLDEVFAWFETNDEENSDPMMASNSLPGIPGNFETSQRYPARIVEALRKHRSNCTIAAAREHAIQESEIVKRVETRGLKIEAVCLMCLENCSDDEKSIQHPFFVGKLCEECSEKYKPTVYAYGDDGKCFFCTICAGSDTVVMCDRDDCPRVYCTACIKYLVAPRFYEDIMSKDPWLCFLCEESEIFTRNGFLKPRHGWKEQVARLFRSNVNSVPKHLEMYNKDDKRKIRVLSLFDGISAGLVVLKKLGIQVEVYYASEIDPDAEMVSSTHHGCEIERLGDVRSISEEKIRGMLPIDLLIGGSPCNDLSLVNPLRLGLHDPNGTGVLFFEYSRIKNLLEKLNGRHFFWLFENVASMPSKYRVEINEHLRSEPQLIDSANYSPQHRPRLYWSNLPTVSFPLSTQDLEDVLTPNCNRHALVKKIRTVTTRVNSLRQGRDALKPILMNETNDTLWITELEEIFGFPKHYTDVKNLCATKRQKLIGMSWSIQTIMEIMRPLCNFFCTRNDEAS